MTPPRNRTVRAPRTWLLTPKGKEAVAELRGTRPVDDRYVSSATRAIVEKVLARHGA